MEWEACDGRVRKNIGGSVGHFLTSARASFSVMSLQSVGFAHCIRTGREGVVRALMVQGGDSNSIALARPSATQPARPPPKPTRGFALLSIAHEIFNHLFIHDLYDLSARARPHYCSAHDVALHSAISFAPCSARSSRSV